MATRQRRPKVSLTLDPDMPGFLQAEADALGVGMSHIARLAIRAYMNARLADHAAAEAAARERAQALQEGPRAGDGQ
jgi:hypothetical protein